MILRFAVVTVVAGVVLTNPTVRAQQSALTQADIDDAIAWGKSGDAAPYLLHHMPGGGIGTNPVVLGVVYTPFVRVALAAGVAFAAHREFTPDDVRQPFVEPVAYIAFRSAGDGDIGTVQHPRPSKWRVALPGDPILRGFRGVQVTASPTWVRSDISVLNDFGGVPYEDIVLVAAYPMAALGSGTDFVICREDEGEHGRSGYRVRIGRIRADERPTWR